MERGESSMPGKRQRRHCVVLVMVAVLVHIVFIPVAIGAPVQQKTEQEKFKEKFFTKCGKFKESDCQEIWEAFQKAYVNQDPCKVPAEAYDALIAAAPFNPPCNRMMFWSKTKDVVHDFTEKKDCFVTLEDTLLGDVLDGETWCGKEGSNETFTSGCPGRKKCDNNPVSSFWTRISAAYADVACGEVTAMLNGSIDTPFDAKSIFGSVEAKRLDATRVKTLNVVLVTQKNKVTSCTNASLKDLQKELDKGIKYNCKEAPQAQIDACSSNPAAACGSCW